MLRKVMTVLLYHLGSKSVVIKNCSALAIIVAFL